MPWNIVGWGFASAIIISDGSTWSLHRLLGQTCALLCLRRARRRCRCGPSLRTPCSWCVAEQPMLNGPYDADVIMCVCVRCGTRCRVVPANRIVRRTSPSIRCQSCLSASSSRATRVCAALARRATRACDAATKRQDCEISTECATRTKSRTPRRVPNDESRVRCSCVGGELDPDECALLSTVAETSGMRQAG